MWSEITFIAQFDQEPHAAKNDRKTAFGASLGLLTHTTDARHIFRLKDHWSLI